MHKKSKNRQAMLIPALLIGGVLLIPFLFWARFVLQPFERYSASSLSFKDTCMSLEGKEFTFQNIQSLNGYCFESCGVACSQAVKCTSDHLKQWNYSDSSFEVTKNPGAPEGYYCMISVDSQNKMKPTAEFITD